TCTYCTPRAAQAARSSRVVGSGTPSSTQWNRMSVGKPAGPRRRPHARRFERRVNERGESDLVPDQNWAAFVIRGLVWSAVGIMVEPRDEAPCAGLDAQR